MSWITYSLALTAYYTLHSIMASTPVKKVFSKIGVNDQIYRILFNIVAIGSSIGIYFIYQATDSSIDRFGSPVGGGLVIIGLGIIINSLLNYDLLTFIGLKKEENNNDLVTKGLNRYVRHPLYLGIIIALVGWTAIYFSAAALSTLGITVIYVQVGIYLEEKKLVQQFGNQYVEYQNQVPKVIPTFWK